MHAFDALTLEDPMTPQNSDLDARRAVEEALWAAEASVSQQLCRMEDSRDARSSRERDRALLDVLLVQLRSRLQARNAYLQSIRP